MNERAADIAEKVAGVTEKVAFGTAGGTVIIAGLPLGDWAFLVGIVATALTAAVGIYCKLQHLKLARERSNYKGERDE